MIVVNILVGLVGLGMVIFVHELGHLIAAKLVGIDVEAFSLGWGRKLVGKTWKGTEYRISVFPVGGYCKMKGERSYTVALEENRTEIPREEGSFFAAAPWKRIVALLAGPAANILLAIVILSVVWYVGFTTESYENRIILASEHQEQAVQTDAAERNPADAAGLQTGDVIVRMDDQQVDSYADIQQIVAQNALTPLPIVVDRDGLQYQLTLTPALDAETGAGYIGVYPWVDPKVAQVQSGSPAEQAGIQPGDVIRSVAGTPVRNSMDIGVSLAEATFPFSVTVVRKNELIELSVPVSADDAQPEPAGASPVLGVAFETVQIPSPDLNILQAVGRGTVESVRILATSVRSLRLLFQGVRLTSAVAGPVRISYYIGNVATSGFAVGFGVGVRAVANFLALLSVVLFFMNLLPIPVLDGGQIILAGVEWIRGKSPHPKVVYRYQLIGGIVVFAILFFALFGDILFLAGR